MILLNIWMKRNMKIFHENHIKLIFLSDNKMEINLDPRTWILELFCSLEQELFFSLYIKWRLKKFLIM